MHHTVTDGNRQASNFCAQELYDLPQGGRHVTHLSPGPCLVDKDATLRASGGEARMDADPLDLAFQEALQSVAHVDSEQLKLDARAAGINDENALGHDSHDRIGCLAIWLRRYNAATAQEAMRVVTLSAREVRMIGTRAPSTIPAASA